MKTSYHVQQVQPSYLRQILAATKSDNIISLAGGLPASDLIPVSLFAEAMMSIESYSDVFQYGETKGYGPLLDYVEKDGHISSNMEAIICNGSQQALDLIARAFLNAGDRVVIESPSYLGALQVFGLAQAQILSVNQNHDGPDLDELEYLFSSNTVKFFYAVPDFHNPTGICWSLEVRKQVAILCEQYGVWFVEDAPYREIRFNGNPLPLVSSLCPDHSILVKSFSKIAAPGIRLGAVLAQPDLTKSLIKVKQAVDLHTGLPMQHILLQVLQHPQFKIHLNQVRQSYHQRYQFFEQELHTLNEFGCTFEKIQGGMFVWLKLPKMDAMNFANQLLAKGVAVVPSCVFYHQNAIEQPALRLNFTHSSNSELKEAVIKIKQTLF